MGLFLFALILVANGQPFDDLGKFVTLSFSFDNSFSCYWQIFTLAYGVELEEREIFIDDEVDQEEERQRKFHK